MTISKGGNQEVQGKTRTTTNALNPDAPEFNPRSRSTGKLNADAPEFVPGQYPVYDPLIFNVPEIKGYKNGHMQTYTLSHQEQVVPVWLSQSYSVDVPFQQLCNNQSLGFFPCDFTQTQNYPIQRNVYKNQAQEYHVNTPYNVVVHGKSKGQKGKVGKLSKEGMKDKDNMSTGRDSVSVATTKDTSREYPPQVKEKPEQEMTWAERTKRSNAMQAQKQVMQPTQQITVPTKETKEQVKQKERKQSVVEPSEADNKLKREESEQKEEEEEVSYAKVFKEAVRSKANVNREQQKLSHVQVSRDHLSNVHVSRDNMGNVHPAKDHLTHVSVNRDQQKLSHVGVNVNVGREETKLVHLTKEQQNLMNVAKEQQHKLVNVGVTSDEKNLSTVMKQEQQHQRLAGVNVHVNKDEQHNLSNLKQEQHKLVNVGKVEQKQVVHTVTFAPTPKDSVSTEDRDVNKLSESTSTDSEYEVGEKDLRSYSVDLMLGYYVYILKNKKIIEEIREEYKLPKINFGTVQANSSNNSSSNSSNNMNKGNYKDSERHKERGEKQDKKDWRHKNYEKNFGNNFRFSNKDFSRASNEFVPTITSSESSWVIKQAKQKSDKEAQFKRKIMGLLNRLTFEKFDIIFNQIIECGIDTAEHAEMLVRFVFGKAVTQHHFIPMYVELCAKLSRELAIIGNSNSNNSDNNNNVSNNVSSSNIDTSNNVHVPNNGVTNSDSTVGTSNVVTSVTNQSLDNKDVTNNANVNSVTNNVDNNNVNNNVTNIDTAKDSVPVKDVRGEEVQNKNRKSDFMRILLNCSQDSFEDNLKPLETPSELEGDDRFEYEQKYKHKMRGNMIFVGELFKQKLLAAKLLITCLDQVFMKREECIMIYDDVNMGNNHLEAVCTLLQTVGRSFDTKRWKHAPELEKRIQHLADLGENELISFRIRCLIKNVLDNRLEHWDKSIYQKEEQPCKLQELRLKHTASSPSLVNNSNKNEKVEKEEMWRMRNNKKKNSSSNLSRGDNNKAKREMSRSFSKELIQEKVNVGYKDNNNNVNNKSNNEDEEDEDEDVPLYPNASNADHDGSYNNVDNDSSSSLVNKLDEEDEDDDNDNYLTSVDNKDKLLDSIKSIIRELVLSHDIEESTVRIEELKVEEERLGEMFKLLIVTCMENCSKVNTEKESRIITKWIVDVAKEKKTINQLIKGLYEFVVGEEGNSMNVMVEDLPLLPKTLELLIENMKTECEDNDKFQEILTHI